MPSDKDLAAEVLDHRTQSLRWLRQNFYPEWRQAFQSYKCERDPETDPNDPGANSTSRANLFDANGRLMPSSRYDMTRTSIGMPDIWSYTRRTVARITAQLPNLKFRAKDPELAERIGRTLMYQWDRGGVQRIQKKHVTQAVLFGWSVRPWHWENNKYQRMKRVDPMEDLAPELMEAIHQQYGQVLQGYLAEDPEIDYPTAMGRLLSEQARGGLLPVRYTYQGYFGPKTEFLFVGDCFPEPNFQSINKSNWFIVERRRNREWIDRVAQAYPEFKKGFDELLSAKPKGSSKDVGATESQELRRDMTALINRVNSRQEQSSQYSSDVEWIITEEHIPGTSPKLRLVGDGGVWIGEIAYPYELEGRAAFTELVLIDDLLSGIGDSQPRVLRGLQLLHDRQVNTRFDLVHNILRPLVYTTSMRLWENPELIKRHGGMRLVKVDHPTELGIIGEQAAIAAAAAGMNDEGALLRLWQMGTGESNMSMAANVDPQQSRTATGARIMAYNQDVLSKDLIDSFNESSLKEDAWIMYLLNRSEMPDAITFDAARYTRNYDSGEVPAEKWMTVTPHDFQEDGEIEVEQGSTLADDDDAKLHKATSIWQMFNGNPMVNQQKLIERVLITLGEGKQLQSWIQPPQPAPPPEPKFSGTMNFKAEMLPVPVQQAVLEKFGMIPPQQEPPSPEGIPGVPEGTPLPTPPPEVPPESEIPAGAGAYAASQRVSPMAFAQ